MSPWRFQVAFLFLCLVLAAAIAAAYYTLATHKAFDPRSAHGPCSGSLTGGPTLLIFCSDGRGYARVDGRWHDAGPLHPLPPVPRR